jgi:hypothetical protein
MAGAKTLFNERNFVQEVLDRWSTHDARLMCQNLRCSHGIFANTPQDFVRHG